MICRTLLMLSLMAGTVVAEDQTGRTLFDFDQAGSSGEWRNVNDGVMGGRSDGRFQITDDGLLRFYGTLSLENNGGFASVRSPNTGFDLAAGDTIVMRVRGDGRKYNMNLYVPTMRIAFAYRADFETIENEWIEVSIPVEDFVATSFGRVVRNRPLDPTDVNRVGIILGDKKAGPFDMQIDWIKVVSADPATKAAESKAKQWNTFLGR